MRKPGGRGAPGAAGGREVPPRGRSDMTCVNCGHKGHAASECRQPKRERAERPCFRCENPGHEAKDCKQPKAAHAVEPGGLMSAGKPPAVVAVTVALPRRQPANLGDFILSSAQKRAVGDLLGRRRLVWSSCGKRSPILPAHSATRVGQGAMTRGRSRRERASCTGHTS